MMNILQHKLLMNSDRRPSQNTPLSKYGIILFVMLALSCYETSSKDIDSIQYKSQLLERNNELRPVTVSSYQSYTKTNFTNLFDKSQNFSQSQTENGAWEHPNRAFSQLGKSFEGIPPVYKSTSPSLELNDKFNKTEINSDDENPLLNEIDGNDIIIKMMEKFFFKYLDKISSKNSIELISGIRILQISSNVTKNLQETNAEKDMSRSFSIGESLPIKLLAKRLARYAATHVMSINVPRALQAGRLIFFGGLKKIMWPIFIAVQVIKSIMFAMFLPSLLGSLGKIVGKGITSVSGFNRPSETISNLEFKDNSLNFEDDAQKFMIMGGEPEYHYQPEASTNHLATHVYNPGELNNNALSRFGMGGEQKVSYMNSAPSSSSMSNSYASKNANSNSDFMPMAQTNNFKVFQNVPASSLLLTNYDPFYSPLLSRLDSVFQQMGQGAGKESCREKIVCLMYSNPAKYAPYSNLVSAQLSRELNELRKPTSDNPDILRFFKYMKAAKDGQDHEDCETIYESCEDFKESSSPAMITTYNDINKLVEARKFK